MPGKVQSSIGQLSDRDSAVALSSNGQVCLAHQQSPSVKQKGHTPNHSIRPLGEECTANT
eukprot:5914730-Amphidinium_carterae.1